MPPAWPRLAGSAGEATAVATTPAATQVSVSLMTQYQRSLSGDRGASVLQEPRLRRGSRCRRQRYDPGIVPPMEALSKHPSWETK